MYPLKFKPIFKERVWGGYNLKNILEKEIDKENIGESWEVSCIEKDVSVVQQGYFQGRNLQELIDEYKEKILGNKVYSKYGKNFPILIKFLDAHQDLSIQVHPNNSLAKKRHNCFGKTEMWYVLHCKENASMIVGFNKDITQQEYQKNLKNNTLSEILNYEKPKKNEVFFLQAGTVHALGSGTMVVEIQQNSDITYRIYDFDRIDKNGKKRELHTALATEAIDYKKRDYRKDYNKTQNTHNRIVSTEFFTTNFLPITGEINVNIKERESFCVYVCVQGKGEISYKNQQVSIKFGESVFVPACCDEIQIKGQEMNLLEIYL